MRSIVLEVLENMGIMLDDIEQTEDIDLTEYIIDSIQFVSFIIELERALDIVLPDNFLLIKNYGSLNTLCEALEELRSG